MNSKEFEHLLAAGRIAQAREEHLRNCLTIWRESANVEDTEPANNFGFMKDPHEDLYPSAFEGTTMPAKTNEILKSHVLNAIDLDFPNSDSFIYFTIYGSGASYNWDEDGDFDIQMWVDFSKYQEQNPEADIDSDTLLTNIRLIVQSINFPSFKELGLDNSECEGAMLIQYYPKPGTGSKEENLASKPYACYDMETDEWLQQPEPITPEFYGDGFLMTMPKAEDVALQAEAVLSELERNTVNWQFWTAMAEKYDHKAYAEEAEDARDKAEQAKDGVVNLFENVFQGRAQAYSEEGSGIKDERDILQKLLEVWGIFQRLKHYARQPLPWEETKESRWVFSDATDDSLTAHILQEGGGTWSKDFIPMSFADGYMVGVKGKGIKLNANELDDDKIANYSKIVDANEMIGAWLNEGEVYLDTVVNIKDLDQALDFAKMEGEIAVWDCANMKEIFVDPQQPGEVFARFAAWTKHADWTEVTEKAQRYYEEGRVQLTSNMPDHVTATVTGDTGTYNTELWRDDPNNPDVISLWGCDCPWGQKSWGRTRIWKKYEGRPCAHAVVVNWESQRQPQDADAQGNEAQQLFDPASTLPAEAPQPSFEQQMADPGTGTAPSVPAAPTAPSGPVKPPGSFLKGPKDIKQMELPGTFSRRVVAVYDNGDFVRAKEPLEGYDDRGTRYIVPQNMVGEVIWSDETATIAIFSIESGPLGAHLVRVECGTDQLMSAPSNMRGPAPRRRR